MISFTLLFDYVVRENPVPLSAFKELVVQTNDKVTVSDYNVCMRCRVVYRTNRNMNRVQSGVVDILQYFAV